MEKKNIVSLWIGRSRSLKAFDQYLEVKYSADGDFLGSQFTRDFEIDYFDQDFIEAEYYASPVLSLTELLAGYSYEETITKLFADLIGESIGDKVNAVVLLYNFKYNGSITANTHQRVKLQYVGAVKYR